MSIPMQLLLVVAAFCLCVSEGAPDGRIARAKQQRPTRGFKNLEMMTARGFGKRSRVSTRAEREIGDQTTLERNYRVPTFYPSAKNNHARGFGKRVPEMEQEGELGDQSFLERTYRTVPEFHSSSKDTFARDFGKRTTEMEQEGEAQEQTPQDRSHRKATFTSKSFNLAHGYGKRTSDMESEGDTGGQLVPERSIRTTHVFKSSVPVGTARDFGKRTAEMEPEEAMRFHPKNSMMVASGFGKRSSDETAEEEEEFRSRRTDFKPENKVNIPVGYGKRKLPTGRVYGLDNFWETLAAPEREGQEIEDDKLESIPLDWFVNEIVNNPDFARSVVRKFVDINQDGMLSADELLRNV